MGPKEAEFAHELSRDWPNLQTVFMIRDPLRRGDEPARGKHMVLAKPFSPALLVGMVREAVYELR
jgi:hypothetical protein